MGKLRTLWFLFHALRVNDSLAWTMVTLVEGYGVYRGLSPEEARREVMALCDESAFLQDLTVGGVMDALQRAERAPRHPLLLQLLERRLSKVENGFDEQGNQAAEEACHG